MTHASPRLAILAGISLVAACSAGTPTVNRVRPAVAPSKLVRGVPLTKCLRARSANGELESVFGKIEASGHRHVPFYFLQAVAGEIVIRLPVPLAQKPSSSGVLAFTVQPEGTVRDIHVDSAGDAHPDSLIIAAIREAGMFRQFAVQLQDLPRLPIRVRLRMWTRLERGDSLRLALADSIRDTPTLKDGEGEKVPRFLPGSPKPQYPAIALPGYNKGEVTARFVMNEAGRIDSTGFSIVRTSHRVFSDAVVAVLPFWRLQPAEASGCVIRSSAEQQFEFSP